MLAQLEERGLVKNLGEAVSNLVVNADEVCLDQVVEHALAEEALPALVLLTAACRVVHEQHGGAAVELGTDVVKEMAEKVAEE
eukprot:6183749-Pleurochrysis_carterae.AAC.2